MFWDNKLEKAKKGYILLYTLIISTLCICIVLYSFTIELKKTRNIESQKNYILANDKHEEYKEKLLTFLYEDILNNVQDKSRDNFKKYLQDNTISCYVDNKEGELKYDAAEDNIIIDSYFSIDCLRRDIYNYDFIDNKLKFIYEETIYIEGRIK